MQIPILYRKRIIPEECVLLKDDIVVERNEQVIITKWNTINPKVTLHHGCSCYFLKEGYKISKFYRADNSLMYWYCDIVEYDYDENTDTYIVTDLLADVIISPEGIVKVVDLDEIAYAMQQGKITQAQVGKCLLQLNSLLSIIYKDKFDVLQSKLENLGL